jgi:hypothetical protein
MNINNLNDELNSLKEQLSKELIKYQKAKDQNKAYVPIGRIIEELKEKIDNITCLLKTGTKTEYTDLQVFSSTLSDSELELKTFLQSFNITEEKFYDTNMAMDSEKVLNTFAKVVKDDYNGNPQGLLQFVKILNVLKSSIPHKDNQNQVVNLISLKLTEKAEEAVPENVESIDEIIAKLKEKCTGKTVAQIRTSLTDVEFHNKDTYIKKLQDINSSLSIAYRNLGMDRVNANNLALADIKNKIKDTFPTDVTVHTVTMQEYTGMDQLVSKFSEALNMKSKANVLIMTGKNARGLPRGNYRGRRPFNNQGYFNNNNVRRNDNNYNNSYGRSNNNNNNGYNYYNDNNRNNNNNNYRGNTSRGRGSRNDGITNNRYKDTAHVRVTEEKEYSENE